MVGIGSLLFSIKYLVSGWLPAIAWMVHKVFGTRKAGR